MTIKRLYPLSLLFMQTLALPCLCFGQVSNDSLKLQSVTGQNNLRNVSLPSLEKQQTITSPSTQKTFPVSAIITVEAIPKNGELSFYPLDNADITTFIESELRNKSEFSISELEAIAANITELVRQDGSLLAHAYLPPQRASSGKVVIAVLKAHLGEVSIEDNIVYDDTIYTSVFDSLKNKPIQRDDVESALQLLNVFLPGANVIGVFAQGQQVGFSDIRLKVTDEKKTQLRAYIDNYGSEATGAGRAGIGISINNILGFTDQLSVDILSVTPPKGIDGDLNCCIGGVRYEMRSSNLKHSVGIEYSNSNFDLGNTELQSNLALLRARGESQRLRLFGNYITELDSTSLRVFHYGISNVTAESFIDAFPANQRLRTRDNVSEIEIGYTISERNINANSFFDASLSLFHEPENGRLESGIIKFATMSLRDDQSEIPSRFRDNDNGNIRLLTDISYRKELTQYIGASLRFQSQFSKDRLVAVQQFMLTGPFAIRAYPVGAFLSDSGAVASAELTYRTFEGMSLRFFLDAGIGLTNNNDDPTSLEFELTPRRVTAAGTGIGLDWQFANVQLNLTGAWALGVGENDAVLAFGGKEADERGEPQLFGSIRVVL